jgi:hypothetical protein
VNSIRFQVSHRNFRNELDMTEWVNSLLFEDLPRAMFDWFIRFDSEIKLEQYQLCSSSFVFMGRNWRIQSFDTFSAFKHLQRKSVLPWFLSWLCSNDLLLLKTLDPNPENVQCWLSRFNKPKSISFC